MPDQKSINRIPGIILILVASIFFTNCSKEFSCENCLETIKPLPPVQGDSVIYYQFTVDNKNYQAIAYQDNFIIANTQDWSNTADRDSGLVFGSALVPSSTSSGQLVPFRFHLERGIMKNYSTFSGSQFQSFFAPGNYSYASLQDVLPPYTPVTQNGFAILWVDEANVIWRTDKGSGNQAGSKFIITNRQDIVFPWSTTPFPMRVSVDFNCKIYDNTGNSKQITNGKLAYYFSKDF